MSASQEIVTIQAGNYANFVGTHWWNMQESSFCYEPNSAHPVDINHDILFREGFNYKREVTFTPRLILIDLKENMKSIRQEGPLYRFPDEKNPLWQGTVDVMQETPVKRNPFLEEAIPADTTVSNDKAEAVPPDGLYDFDSPTTYWSDFLKTNLHPKSFCLMQEITSDDKSPLETYSSGDEVYKKYGVDLIEESIRKMTEDCDYLQGFQLIYDSHNGFSGIVNHVLQHVDDEYARRSSLCFPTFQSNKPFPILDTKEQMHRLFAILLSLNSMTGYSSLFSPLCLSSDVVNLSKPFRTFPFLQYDANMQYQTSSILAAAIDTLTSQFRLKTMKFCLSDVTSAMSMYSRKLACSSLSLPFPLSDDAFLNTMTERDLPEYYMTSISPFYNPKCEKTLHQSAVLRGIPKSKFMKPNKSFYAVEPEQLFGEYLNKYSSSSVSTATVLYEKCKVMSPFPKIFKNLVGLNGVLQSEPHLNVGGQHVAKRLKPLNARSCHCSGVEEVAIAASLSSSDSAAQFLDSLLDEARRNSFKEYIKCAESSYAKDDFEEVMQNLFALRDNYQDY